MKAIFFYCLLFTMYAGSLNAQRDSIPVNVDRPDGIYLSYQDFRKNRFIEKAQVISGLRTDDLDFLAKTLHQRSFEYTQSTGGASRISAASVWGFYQNNTMYVNYEGAFCRVTTFGAMSYLVTAQRVLTTGEALIAGNTPYVRQQKEKIVEYLFNFYDGKIKESKIEAAEEILVKDPALFSEYEALGWQEQKIQIKRFIRRYNEAHPVYFLK